MFIPPMLLETVEEAFDSPDHIFEPKIDGHRLIYSREAGEIQLYTKDTKEVTLKYPELWTGIHEDVVLDGEAVITDPATGDISSVLLKERLQLSEERRIEASAASHPVNFIVFDVLHYRGHDLRALPLMRRKAILQTIRIDNPNISVIPYVQDEGVRLFESIREQRMEGIVAKKKDSKYFSGRRVPAWQNVIHWTTVDVVITGYRRSKFGWLVSMKEGDQLRPAGMITSGVTFAHKQFFYSVCKKIESGSYKDIIHLEPTLRAKIKTRNFSRNGMLRNPVFIDFIA